MTDNKKAQNGPVQHKTNNIKARRLSLAISLFCFINPCISFNVRGLELKSSFFQTLRKFLSVVADILLFISIIFSDFSLPDLTQFNSNSCQARAYQVGRKTGDIGDFFI